MPRKLTKKQISAFLRQRQRTGAARTRKAALAIGSCVAVGKRGTTGRLLFHSFGEICRERDGYYFRPSYRVSSKAELRELAKRMKGQVWIVHEGRPSWHQQRAGHVSAASTVFTGKNAEQEARDYIKQLKERDPNKPAFAVRER